MKASMRMRLQQLEHAAAGHERMPIVLIDVTQMPGPDREAYWAGNEEVLRRYGAPIPGECPPGSIHTLVIDVHPACWDPRRDDDDLADGEVRKHPAKLLATDFSQDDLTAHNSVALFPP